VAKTAFHLPAYAALGKRKGRGSVDKNYEVRSTSPERGTLHAEKENSKFGPEKKPWLVRVASNDLANGIHKVDVSEEPPISKGVGWGALKDPDGVVRRLLGGKLPPT